MVMLLTSHLQEKSLSIISIGSSPKPLKYFVPFSTASEDPTAGPCNAGRENLLLSSDLSGHRSCGKARYNWATFTALLVLYYFSAK
jgi:hypothetical protein